MIRDYNELEPIDALEFVTKHPHKFLPSGTPVAFELIAAVVNAVLVFEGREAVAIRIENWWVVGSDNDWISQSLQAKSIQEYFRSLVAFPEAGINCFHPEILLTAFANDVVTFNNSQLEIIKGRAHDINSILEYRRSRRSLLRIVAFRMDV